MTYLLGDFLKHRKFPSKLVVAAWAAKILRIVLSVLPISAYAQDDTVSANMVLKMYFRAF